ncbi:hypothetical protein ABIC32_002473 [Brevundimonas sp. 1080]
MGATLGQHFGLGHDKTDTRRQQSYRRRPEVLVDRPESPNERQQAFENAGVTEIVSGPKATALRIAAARRPGMEASFPLRDDRRWSEDRMIVDAANDQPHDTAFIEKLLTELAAA